MILVTGAAGKTGRAIITTLAARGQRIRALVHHEEQRRLIESIGAGEIVVGDMHDEATLRRACQNVRAVYHICPNASPDEVPIGKAAISSARDAQVEHFVFHSVLHPQTHEMTHHWNKLRVEEMLFESGMSYTVLQPAPYMQNILAGWKAIVERGIYPVPYSVKSRMSMVDLEDVAQAAATVLSEPGHLGATYELAGPDVLTQVQVAEIAGKLLGRAVKAEQITIEAWTQQAQALGMGTYQIETLVKMFQYYNEYGLWGNPRILGYLIRREPTKLEAYVERVIKGGSHVRHQSQ